ncbi:MAG: glycerophosphodiester phosphodiesterase [Candidatus Latescibacteria bacterium]|nr:glycerophosphodiester phosphodiesterase [Candidatus Latescibacterota bacterium]
MPFGHRTLSIAHRGASGMAPENTLIAVERALDLGVDVVEIDVHVTRDGHVVVLHDATVDRTTDGRGAVRDMTLAEVRRLNAGLWFDPPCSGERIPTLAETLDLTRRRALLLVEIKASGISEQVIETIRDLRATEDVIVQSFHPATVKQVRDLERRIPAALLVGRVPVGHTRWRGRSLVKKALKVGANALALSYLAATPSLVDEVHRRAMSLWVWTVDEEFTMQKMIQTGADGIITNHPERLHRLLTGEIIVPPRRLFLRRGMRRRRLWKGMGEKE